MEKFESVKDIFARIYRDGPKLAARSFRKKHVGKSKREFEKWLNRLIS